MASNRSLTPRQRARDQILNRANRVRDPMKRPYTLKHLQHAVFVCRQRGLVPETVLIGAGFNPKRHR